VALLGNGSLSADHQAESTCAITKNSVGDNRRSFGTYWFMASRWFGIIVKPAAAAATPHFSFVAAILSTTYLLA